MYLYRFRYVHICGKTILAVQKLVWPLIYSFWTCEKLGERHRQESDYLPGHLYELDHLPFVPGIGNWIFVRFNCSSKNDWLQNDHACWGPCTMNFQFHPIIRIPHYDHKFQYLAWGSESLAKTKKPLIFHRVDCNRVTAAQWEKKQKIGRELIFQRCPGTNHFSIFNFQFPISSNDYNSAVPQQITAARCNTLQHPAPPCNTLQHTTTHRNTLQHTATHCNTLQHTATHCKTLQHTAAHCNTLQHTATHCNTLQHFHLIILILR